MLTRREFLKLALVAAAGTAGGRPYPASKQNWGGQVLIVGGMNFLNLRASDKISAELYDPATHAFTPTRGIPVNQRTAQTATLLRDGRVLLAGGSHAYTNAFASAELYDPASGIFSAVQNEMIVPRAEHTATSLGDGKVLIVGGNYSTGGGVGASPIGPREPPRVPMFIEKPKHYPGGTAGPLASAELYDPEKAVFTPTGRMKVARAGHSATLLDDGRVLVAGGYRVVGRLDAAAELYDPAKGIFTPTGSMNFRRTQHSAVKLRDGRVLIAGGGWTNPHVASTAELYDPQIGIFKPTGEMMVGRRELCATTLVLVAGGKDVYLMPLASAEVYDPGKGTFAPTHMMKRAWEFAAATLLTNGKVLLTGAIEMFELSKERAPAQEFDPATLSFSNVGEMIPRQGHTATLLV
jgi:hypothetical protein